MRFLQPKSLILCLSMVVLLFSCSEDETPPLSCTIGSTCNDGDPLTINDVYDSNCNCSGTTLTCTVGAPCNDGNPLTENDVYDSNCYCSGTTPDCVVGDPCDDGNPITENDVFNDDCTCSGTLICTPGAPCDDGNPITENDIFDANCDCAGSPICTEGEACDDGNPNTYSDVFNSVCQCQGVAYGTLTDFRDGEVYNTIVIGTQKWMAENLRYENGNSWCYSDVPLSCIVYGRLYDWESANAGACPAGWHLPTDEEWTILTDFLGGEGEAGHILKDAGDQLWLDGNTGNNYTGFAAEGGGRRFNSDGSFGNVQSAGYWWTATEISIQTNGSAQSRYMIWNGGSVTTAQPTKLTGQSVRCVEN